MVTSAAAPDGGRNKPPHLSKQSLSASRSTLLALMQRINFGRLEGLHFHDGEPVFDPTPRLQREIKFAGENGPHRHLSSADFLLKQQVVELFDYFDQQRDGVVDLLEVKHGLPFRMVVTEESA
jgi:hypothetical protein